MGSGNVREKDGQPLNIDLLYNSDSVTEKSIAEYLQSEYQSIGVSLNIHGEEEQSYRDNMKAGNFDMGIQYLLGYTIRSTVLSCCHARSCIW